MFLFDVVQHLRRFARQRVRKSVYDYFPLKITIFRVSSFKDQKKRFGRDMTRPKKRSHIHIFCKKNTRLGQQELQLERRIMEDKTKDYKQPKYNEVYGESF